MLEQLRNKIHLDNDKWSRYTSCFRQMQVPAKTVLLKEGEISKKLFLIEKGCIRVWFNNNGKNITFQFFFENNVVASIESFRKKIPSPVSIETLEPSTVWGIHKKDLDKIVEEIKDIPALRDLFIGSAATIQIEISS
jgi:CRP-like cAMP-binding protein